MDNKFEPHKFYNKAGDTIEVVTKPGSQKGLWINNDLTILLDMETDEIIGAIVSGIKHLGLVPKE
jgi:hypothetical protein